MKITTEGQRHLGAVIGSRAFKKLYCNEKINEWMKELLVLCEIADTHPQAAYSAYAKGFKSKFTYFLRTIENFEEFVEPIDNLISEKFIPTLFGLELPLENLRDVFALNPSDGGLRIPFLKKEAPWQHGSSIFITKPHIEAIGRQSQTMTAASSEEDTQENLKKKEKKGK